MMKIPKRKYRTDEERLVVVSLYVAVVVVLICFVLGYLGNIGILKF